MRSYRGRRGRSRRTAVWVTGIGGRDKCLDIRALDDRHFRLAHSTGRGYDLGHCSFRLQGVGHANAVVVADARVFNPGTNGQLACMHVRTFCQGGWNQ